MTDPRAFWDAEAPTFDDEPDHGLHDPAVREAWRQLLRAHLPPPPSDVVDLGCGTGTLSVLLAEAGHRVRALDLSPAMVAAARAKAAAAGLDVDVTEGDASDPHYDPASCDVVLSRHVLWALPHADALARWTTLLRPAGRLVLVEGRWHTGAGLDAATCEALVREHLDDVHVVHLTDEVYWGGRISDERYLMVARRRSGRS